MASDGQEIFLYKESPDAWQTKVQGALGIPFPLAWIVVGLSIFGGGALLIWLFEDDFATLALLGIECVLIAAIANSVVYCERLLDEVADAFPELLDDDAGKVREWVKGWYRSIFWSHKTIIAGLIGAPILAAIDFRTSSDFYLSWPARAYSVAICSFMGFLAGSLVWTMLGVARITWSLGKDVSIKPSIFDTRTSALRAASSVLRKITLLAVLLYLFGMSMHIICDVEPSLLGLVVEGLAGLFLLLYFIIPQLNIHKTLTDLKRSKLRHLVLQIESSFDKVASDPTRENINQLKELFDLQKVVNGRNAWSFGTGELLMLVGSIILPLVLFALNWVLKSK